MTSMGMFPASSPSLQKDGAFIATFTVQSLLCFYGNLKIRVLGGLIKINSYILKPSDRYLDLSIPHSYSVSAAKMEVIDPKSADEKFSAYMKPFHYSGLVHFYSATKPCTSCSGKGCVLLDIGQEDIDILNSLVKNNLKNVTAVALIKPLENDLTRLLAHYGLGIQKTHRLNGLSIARIGQTLIMPQYYDDIARDISAHHGASVLICGESGTGKSTLGRSLINRLLNKFQEVAFLECDPGQCEFTCPEVLSLHVLKKAVFGPPYTHQRTPFKAYYFGDTTPKADPEYYIRSLQSLHSCFVNLVRSMDPSVPLIINTCGWLNDMGVQLFLDILRSLKPSHVVRLTHNKTVYSNILKALPPLTEDFLTTTPGLFTTADRPDFNSMPVDTPHSVQHKNVEEELVALPKPWTESEYSSSDIEMYGSSEEEFSISQSSESEDKTSPVDSKEERIRKKRKLKRKRLHLINAKLNEEKRQALEEKRCVQISIVKEWVQVLFFKTKCVLSPKTIAKNSKHQRTLGLMTHLSPLLHVARDIAKEHNLPNPYDNMLNYTPPLEVPWKDVAIHIIHKPVPVDFLLYAFNSKIVCLGQALPEQIIEFSNNGMFKILKSRTPLIEFIGLGLLRGIDPVKKIFYVSTPISANGLEMVNVFVLGNSDKIDVKASPPSDDPQNVPYQTDKYQPTELGQYVWNHTKSRM